MVSASLAYERPYPVKFAGKRTDQGYALPAQGYAIAPANTDYAAAVPPAGGYGAPEYAPAPSAGCGSAAAYPQQSYGAPVPSYAPAYPVEYIEEGK